MLIQYGTTAHFTVSYDSTFTGGSQPDGKALSQAALDYCEYDWERLSLIFGPVTPPAGAIPIAIDLVIPPPMKAGANNNGYNQIQVLTTTSDSTDTLPGLIVAEMAELFMSYQGKGWIAGWSNGEGLSRSMGGVLYPAHRWLFQSGQPWLNSARQDWVDEVEHTDQDVLSYGCSTLFLYWLADQLGHSWPSIVQAGAPNTNTLAETATLLGVSNAWQSFSALINAQLPPGSSLPAQPPEFGQPPAATDDPYPLGPPPSQPPALYLRHNLADDGTSHTGTLSDSPDIIMKNSAAADPQATFSTAASIGSDTESDPYVIGGQTNYVYLRAWNRGSDAPNTFAMVYWSPPSTLVSPDLWTLIGSSYWPDTPPGQMVEVSNPGIVWPADQIPGNGHYCFVATVGNAASPPPSSGSFASFDDYEDFIYANNNITWRNFNVGPTSGFGPIPPWGGLMQLPVLIPGAWDQARRFELEVEVDLPEGSRLVLDTPHWLGRKARPANGAVDEIEDMEREPADRRRALVPLPHKGRHALGEFELPRAARAWSRMLVEIPDGRREEPRAIIIRQLYRGREAGRVTWLARKGR